MTTTEETMMTEFKPIMEPKHYRMVIHTARQLATRINKRKPNWVMCMDLFLVGSSHAWWICKYAGIEGDAKSVGDVWRKEA